MNVESLRVQVGAHAEIRVDVDDDVIFGTVIMEHSGTGWYLCGFCSRLNELLLGVDRKERERRMDLFRDTAIDAVQRRFRHGG